tara:strand:- start:687 stop:848 length:162 start_codon:yes stop_codon:yes gene_type:complete
MKNKTIKLLTLSSSLIFLPMFALALSLGINNILVLCGLIWYVVATININNITK